MIAAGWGDESKPPVFRYAFLGVAALRTRSIVIWIAFNIDSRDLRATVVEGSPQLDIASALGHAC